MKRTSSQRKFNKTIFILCQGTVTEVQYFNHISEQIWFNKNVAIKIKPYHNSNALQFIRLAIKNYKDDINSYDEFWVVFDKDETSDDDFNKAVNLAEQSKLKVAYSNQAFEVWLIHHFQELFSAFDRNDYETTLNKLLEFDYGKDEKTAKKVAETLFPKIEEAIKNSENSYNKIEKSNPANEESSTMVYQLAKSILNYNN
ncbi:MAG TPA: RloB family protein [Candidatus Kapabacteria bacterium]|nr:RloB family protein [Candidatus Kapabacteria bacterium]HPO63038.1 RloB family protein [Candidatus Kapabacteria bacterium]